MELFNPFEGSGGVWFTIVYVIAILWFAIPLFVGIPLCLRNRTIPGWYKAGWCLAFLLFGMFAFFLYLVIYSRHVRNR